MKHPNDRKRTSAEKHDRLSARRYAADKAKHRASAHKQDTREAIASYLNPTPEII